MTTSHGNFPPERLTKIDKLNRPKYLDDNDKCYYMGEYTIGGGEKKSETNQIILDYKMYVSWRETRPEVWPDKAKAIQAVAAYFWTKSDQSIKDFWTKSILVPLPPSKAKGDTKYDDRNTQMLKMLKDGVYKKYKISLNVQELIFQKNGRAPMHNSNIRPKVEEIQQNFNLSLEQGSSSAPESIALFDDIVINGTTFKAAQNILKNEYPNCEIRGFFIARGKHKIVL